MPEGVTRHGKAAPGGLGRALKRFWQLTSFCFVISVLVFVTSSPYDQTSSRVMQTKQFNSSCSCQSLFTIGACGLSQYYNNRSLPESYRLIFKEIETKRNGDPSFIANPLKSLSRLLPKMWYFDFKNTNKYLRENVLEDATYTAKMRETINSMSYIPCNVHFYSPKEINACLTKRKEMTGRILKIAFVGDSQVRNLLEQMIMFLRVELNLRAGNSKGFNLTTDFLNQKYKDDLPIEGEGIQLRMYWSTFLARNRDPSISKQGAKDLLQTWAQNRTSAKGEEVPDILYFNDGMWGPGETSEWGAISVVEDDFDKLKPYLQNISRTTRLILRTQTPLKKWVAKQNVANSALDMMNQLAWLTLRDTDIWIWDTITPVYLRHRADCKAYWNTGLGGRLPPEWACGDFQHPSKLSETIAGNMIWNYVCNGVMRFDQQHCCV
ncbi:uncharacterized protein LOC108675650 [Hyalella azteca]|uniref:Uncharacterized protein LOC108675650 n=1 Tax=Hyalella azteca TaxID=294128 RepID=A0A8B7NZG8_HYAAZ|nr:uncharacterized protein LOC108675650 [Hyalella azteca]